MNINNIKEDQRGIVSLLVCMIMMIVVSLIAIGLIELSNNEVHNALNSQLSQQAYYAADSGINNATAVIQNDLQHSSSIPSQSQCSGKYTQNPLSNTTGTTNDSSYPCVLVNTTPTSLQYPINVGTSQVIPVIVPSGQSLSTITLSWQESVYSQGSLSYSSGCVSVNIPVYGSESCAASPLQIDIVPITTSSLNNEPDIFYLFPAANGPTSVDLATNPSGEIKVGCTAMEDCQIKLENLAANGYYIKVLPLYGSRTDLQVKATDASGGSVNFSNTQAVITSTGKAQNVLQSLESIINTSSLNPDTPSFAIQSQNSICADQSSAPPAQPYLPCNSIEGP